MKLFCPTLDEDVAGFIENFFSLFSLFLLLRMIIFS